MKKFTLITALFATLGFANVAFAQSFTTDKDTNKVAWIPGGFNVDVHIKAINSTSSPITINWRMVYLHKDSGWTLEGACDNLTCKVEGDPGLVDGTATFTTSSIAVADNCNFKLSFNGDAAAFGTKSVATLEFKNGTTTDSATFIAYKGTLGGITTTLLQDNNVSIFPNPAQNYIDVLYNSSSDVNTIALYNLIGKVVSVFKVTDKNSARCEFNADMPSGIYIVRIADSKGNVIATRKITRQ